jgi:hypothetical protein
LEEEKEAFAKLKGEHKLQDQKFFNDMTDYRGMIDAATSFTAASGLCVL